jgi:hypothetical protein
MEVVDAFNNQPRPRERERRRKKAGHLSYVINRKNPKWHIYAPAYKSSFVIA